MRKLLCLLSIIICSTCVYGQNTIIKPGDDASHYKLKIVSSPKTIKEVPVRELKGNIIILSWWDKGCHLSKEQLKKFNASYTNYNDRVLFYAVSDDSWSYITKYAEKNNYKYSFCSDASKLENQYFPHTSSGHTVIINRDGICLHHGSFNISNELLDTLISKDHLPIETQRYSDENYKLKQFRDDFEEYGKSFNSINQTGFKLEPHNSILGRSNWIWAGGEFKSYYGYNQSIYEIYRSGLRLTDSRIIIPDSLKKELNSTDIANLYNVGFNIRKENKYSNYRYRNVFRAYLDSAFSLSTRLVKSKEDVIIIKKINESPNILKAGFTEGNSIDGDLLLKGFTAKTLVSTLNEYLPVTFGTAIQKQKQYDFTLTLNKDSTNRQQIVDQLKKQGIDSKIKTRKLTYLEFLDQKEFRPVSYFHTQTKPIIFRYGYKIGTGRSHYEFSQDIYQGDKVWGFSAGFFSQIKLSNHLALQPELNYLTSGCKGDYAKYRTHSIFTPVNILLTTSQNKGIGFYTKVGGYYAYNFAETVQGQKHFYNNFDKSKFGWSWGLGFWLENSSLELSYIKGLSSIKKNSIVGDVKEKMWMLTRIFYF